MDTHSMDAHPAETDSLETDLRAIIDTGNLNTT